MNTTMLELSTRTYYGLVSAEVRYIVQVIFFIALSGVVSVFGMSANVINMIVFFRQGFRDSINFSLMGLAVADFMFLLTMFWISFSASPMFEAWKLPFHESDVTYMTGGWPRLYFIRVSSLITAFVTLERCLCIAFPLKIKEFITPWKTKVIISSIFIFSLVFFIPFYCVNRLEWRYNQLQNRTLLTIVYTKDKVTVEIAIFPVYGVCLPVTTLLTVIVCSIILVIQLNKTREWRNRSLATSNTKEGLSSVKDKKVVKMVTCIALISIICYLPEAVNFVAMTCEPELSVTGKYNNVYFIVWSVTVFLETLCSSVNIFVYYSMSSKFMTTLNETFYS